MRRQLLAASVSLALGGAGDAAAVFLNPQGHGQALIYPYYTVRSTNGNAFNTFISVVNHMNSVNPNGSLPGRGKALRVRFREGRNGREVANFNLYLAPNDVWTAAIIPTAEGTSLITSDLSCTSPGFTGPQFAGLRELAFSDAQYTGANADGGPVGLDRTREGYVEIIEMANVSGAAATAFTHNAFGIPANCAAVQGNALVVSVSAPSGGLSGTVTLINVANGMDFTANAEALDDVFARPLYRRYDDPYPDWNASEVKRTSHITANGKQYRLQWAIAVDAVSSVLTRSSVLNEYIRDANTLSQTDWVLTFPTRRLHANNFGTAAPFTAPQVAGNVCEETGFLVANRDERVNLIPTPCEGGFGAGCPPALTYPTLCHAATVVNYNAADSSAATPVLGSVNRAIGPQTPFANGWAQATFVGVNARGGLESLSSSVARDLETDQGTTAVQRFIGLPVVGFMVRTFVNGTLACAAGSCQGNYGGLFPHRYQQRMTGP